MNREWSGTGGGSNVGPLRKCAAPGCHNIADNYPAPICERHAHLVWAAVNEDLQITPQFPSAKVQRDRGHIYVVRLGNRIKIGYSTEVTRRLKNIPHEEVIATFYGGMDREKELHRMFDEYRITGEWFKVAQPIIDYCRPRHLPELLVRMAPQKEPLAVGPASLPPELPAPPHPLAVPRMEYGKRMLRNRLRKLDG